MSGLAKRLRTKADEAECAADAEAIIADGLMPFRAKFENGDRSNYTMRRLRVLLDAEKAERGFKVDTKDFRTAADAVDALPE